MLLVLFILNTPALDAAETDNNNVCIQPLKKHKAWLVPYAKKGIEYFYGYKVIVLPEQEMPKRAWYAPRKRYRAEKLLSYLIEVKWHNKQCDMVLGLTHQDISTTKGKAKDWGIFGLGMLDGSVAVVSTYRLHFKTKNKNKIIKRTVQVINHELGHVLGLSHCHKESCLMHAGNATIENVDNISGAMCNICWHYLTKYKGMKAIRKKTIEWDKILK